MVSRSAVVAAAVLAIVIVGAGQLGAAPSGAPVIQAGHQAALPPAARQSPGADAKTPAVDTKATAVDTKTPAAKAPDAKPAHDTATPPSAAKPAPTAEVKGNKAAAKVNSQEAVAETVARIRAMMAEQAVKSAPGKATTGGTARSNDHSTATVFAAGTSPVSRQSPAPGGVRLLWNIPPVPGGIRLQWDSDFAAATTVATTGTGVRLQWPVRVPD